MIIFEDDNSQFGSYFFMSELSEDEKREILEYEAKKEIENEYSKSIKSVA